MIGQCHRFMRRQQSPLWGSGFDTDDIVTPSLVVMVLIGVSPAWFDGLVAAGVSVFGSPVRIVKKFPNAMEQ